MSEPDRSETLHSKGERKQITAVFVDVVGFSDIASTADAEDLEAWLEDYYSQSKDIIEQHDGEVTEYLGDGIVALFGLTKSDELSAAKGVNAAIKAVTDINAGYRGEIDVKLRAGVATGEVAVRATGRQDKFPRATGTVTTLAQRIQERAAPGTVMISESTRRLLRGSISVETVPDQMLKGFAEAQTLYTPQLQQPSLPQGGPQFFVGRKVELDRIAQAAQPSLVVGQAGIGKTAICQRIASDFAAVTVIAADGVQTRSSYQPFKDWIAAQIGTRNPNFAQIADGFSTLDTNAHRALALALGLAEGQRLLAEQSNVALKALIEQSFWQALQAKAPDGLLVFEDLHWLDNASFGVLVAILTSEAAQNYTILMTSREDTKIGKYLGNLPINVMGLDKLDDAAARAMIDALSDGLTDVARDEVIEKSAGVPLFLEQLSMRSKQSGGAGALPSSLMDLLGQQIDATGPAKPVLQCAAVLGRTFDTTMLQVIAAEYAPLDPHLERARQSRVLQKDKSGKWTFAHALLQQAAYQSLLRRTRVDYHSQVAAELQENHADTVQRNPAMLADHLGLAQQHVPAIQNYLAASHWASLQGAFDDANAHILAALSLCDEAPKDIDVTDLRILCHTALGSVRIQTLGFTSDPAKQAFDEVEKLASSQGQHSKATCPAFYGSFTHAILSGDKAGATRFADLYLETLAHTKDTDAEHEVAVGCHNVQVALNFYQGNFEEQFNHFAKVRDIYDITKHGAMIAAYGADIFAAAQMFEPVGRAICGQTHLVPDLSAETDAHQVMLNIPVMAPYAKIWGAVPLFYSGDHATAIARVKEGISAAHDQSAAFWQVTGAAWLAVMDPAASETEEGLAQFEQVIQTHEMIGALVGVPYFRVNYALALARHGRLEDAYSASFLAVRECEESGLYCWFAEVLRLHAGICEKVGRKDDAALFLDRAVKTAKGQGALLWLIRALIDQAAHGIDFSQDIQALLPKFHAEADLPEIEQARALIQ